MFRLRFPKICSSRPLAAGVSPVLRHPCCWPSTLNGTLFATKPMTTMISQALSSHRLTNVLDGHSLMKDTESELFNYTKGCFLANNDLRLAQRKRLFDVPGLLAIVERTLNHERKVVGFRKLGEGGLNRSFLVTLDDDSQLVVRIPYTLLVPRALTLASEVATMHLLGSQGFPVPRVRAYAITPDNEAQTEYMIMDLVPGIDLSEIWFNLDEVEIRSLMDQLAKLEATLMSIPFDSGGSIYFVDDLRKLTGSEGIPLGWANKAVTREKKMKSISPQEDSEGAVHETRRFCLGPDVSPTLWYGRREGLDVFRGPYEDVESALVTGARKESEYLKRFGSPRAPYRRYRRQFYGYEQQLPGDHAANLKRYLLLAPSLMLEEDPINDFCIRHPDLTENNIKVSRLPDGGLRIEGLLDWQHAVVYPRFLLAGVPNALQNRHDEASRLCARPELPPDFEQLSEGDQRAERERLRCRRLRYYHLGSTEELNKTHYDAIVHPLNPFRRRIFTHASEMWEGESINLQRAVINMIDDWEWFAKGDEPCPVKIAPAERDAAGKLYRQLREAEDDEDRLAGYVGYGDETWVPAANYKEARGRAQDMRRLTLQAYEEDENAMEEGRAEIVDNWPLGDMTEDELREYE